MAVSVSHQATVFILCFFCGTLIGLIFDFFRIVRRLIKTGVAATGIHDVIFCILALTVVLLFSIRFNYGEIRWYMIFAVFSGSGFYFLTLSKIIIKISVFVLQLSAKIIIVPLKLLVRIFKKPIFLTLKVGKISFNKLKFKITPFKKYVNVLKKRKNMI